MMLAWIILLVVLSGLAISWIVLNIAAPDAMVGVNRTLRLRLDQVGGGLARGLVWLARRIGRGVQSYRRKRAEQRAQRRQTVPATPVGAGAATSAPASASTVTLAAATESPSPASSPSTAAMHSYADPALAPLEVHRRLLNPNEQQLYRKLQIAAGPGRVVFANVCLADLIGISHKAERWRRWAKLERRLKARRISFVLCAADNLRILLAIELDNSSQRVSRRKKTDELKTTALARAGLPLLRIAWQQEYDSEALAREIQKRL